MAAINKLNGIDQHIVNNVVSSRGSALGTSFLRFANSSAAAGTVTVTLQDAASGAMLGTWTSPSIPPQFPAVRDADAGGGSRANRLSTLSSPMGGRTIT